MNVLHTVAVICKSVVVDHMHVYIGKGGTGKHGLFD